ncbi:MAG: UDP-3-O-(3-hydroxymyristoyl)glucosamine N-acyltransferase [Ignavibacteriales bacterium]|nr:UDP-3-O-(3-hydroxymyristoyl)glucosamine N-acyltransferase [Ignavibacteriales bacterium]
MTLREIATFLHGELVGDGSVEITRVAKIEEARPGELTFLANPKYEKYLAGTKASAVLVSTKLELRQYGNGSSPAFIKVQDPYVGFLQILKILTPTIDPFPKGVHPSAVIAKSATLGKNVAIGANAVVGEKVIVGDNTKISHGCVIGDHAVIGNDCLLYPNVTMYHQCKVGNRVTIHSGTVIGSDGFGFAPKPDGTYEKIPQLGIVLIEDDVEIGSNCSIDRATLGETTIRHGVKLDNLIQIAHNVVIGENTVIASQTGISGSTKIGKNSIIAGQVGIVGHIEIAEKSTILAQSGIPKSLTEPGKTYFGYPAKEHLKALRIEAIIRSLPELVNELRELQQKVEALAKKFQEK